MYDNVALMPNLEQLLSQILEGVNHTSDVNELVSQFEEIRADYILELDNLRSKYMPSMIQVLNQISKLIDKE